MGAHPELAAAVALASLPKVGPGRLRALIQRYGAEGAWRAVLDGTADPDLVRRPGKEDPRTLLAHWRRDAARLDPDDFLQRHVDAGVGAVLAGSAGYPEAFAAEEEPPAVVFFRGDLDHLAGMRAAIVGTRDATRYGLDVARSMGADLAIAGVSVVSGLALGIDGAAHGGVLAVEGAPPVGVVGSGLDRVYPRRHAGLWQAVAERGLLLSEYPLGSPAAAWQFPARNRLIAALADVVVVVESHATGGAMGTAVEADHRGRTVLAVPGPVTSPSSAGTNQLLFEGRGPARDAADVLLAMGLSAPRRRPASEQRAQPHGPAAVVLGAVTWQPVAVEQLVLATGLDVGAVVVALDELEREGWVDRSGGWVERVARDRSPSGRRR